MRLTTNASGVSAESAMKNSDGKAMTDLLPDLLRRLRSATAVSEDAAPYQAPAALSDSTGEFEGTPGQLREKQHRPVTIRVLFELSEQCCGTDLQLLGGEGAVAVIPLQGGEDAVRRALARRLSRRRAGWARRSCRTPGVSE
jgi:hypothetical protein